MARKSFMFTTKKHSITGILSVLLGVTSLTGLIAAIIVSFMHRGATPMRVACAGLIGVIASVTGAFAGLNGSQERDTYLLFPRIGTIMNIVMMILWIIIVVLGIKGIIS